MAWKKETGQVDMDKVNRTRTEEAQNDHLQASATSRDWDYYRFEPLPTKWGACSLQTYRTPQTLLPPRFCATTLATLPHRYHHHAQNIAWRAAE